MLSHQKVVLFIGDIAALVASFCVMALIRFDVGAQGGHIWYEVRIFALLFIIWLIVFFIFDLYNLRRINPNPRNIGLLIAAMIPNALLGVLLFYLIPNVGISPKTNLAILVAASFGLMVLWRRLFYLMFTKRFVRRIIIIGNNPFIEHLTTEIEANPHIGTVVATWKEIPETSAAFQAELVIADGIDPEALFRLSQALNTELLSLTEAYETIFAKIPIELMTPQQALYAMTNRVTPAQHVVYRIAEIIVASVVLIITSPFLAFAIIARAIEDGTPIFYTQTRVGKGGKRFAIYKLRSMKKDAEKNGAQWADKADTRITKLGRILRKTHIDEVPQMYNIIKGDLALIGPRPERPEFVATLESEIPYYYLRHTIRPGFTGWAQIKFRYAATVLDSKEKFEYDLYYLKHKHPLLDIGIVLKTLQIIFTH